MKIIFLFFTLVSTVKADTCDDWFNKLELKDKNCVTNCALAAVDMATVSCTLKCDALCKRSKEDDSNFYGLTSDEIEFCNDNKIKCLNAYKLSWSAEKLCLKIYPASRTNDESDACRHYIWAFLLIKEFNLDFTQKILEAHESKPKEPEEERKMDIFNNTLAINIFKNLGKNKNLSEEEILRSFKDQLKNKKLMIIKPRYKNNGGLP